MSLSKMYLSCIFPFTVAALLSFCGVCTTTYAFDDGDYEWSRKDCEPTFAVKPTLHTSRSPINTFKQHDPGIVKIARSNISEDLINTHFIDLFKIAALPEPAASYILDHIDSKTFAKDVHTIFKVIDVIGIDAYGLLKVSNMDELDQPGIIPALAAVKRRMTMDRQRRLNFEAAARVFSPATLLGSENQISRLADVLAYDAEEILLVFKKFTPQYDFDFIFSLTEIMNRSPREVLTNAFSNAVKVNPALFLEIAKLAPSQIDEIVRHLSPAFIKKHGADIISLVRTNPLSAAGLLDQFGADAFWLAPLKRESLLVIEKFVGDKASDFVGAVPVKLWDDREVVAAIEFYGDDAVEMYRYSLAYSERGSSFDWLTVYKTPLFELNRSIFGIKHFSRFIRYADDTPTFPLLEENIKNMVALHDAHKPIALFIFAEHDWNAALHPNVATQAYPLTDKYKLFVAEVGNKNDITTHLQHVSLLKKVNLLILDAHAHTQAIELNIVNSLPETQTGGRDMLTNGELTTDDKKLIREWVPYIGGPGATIFLSGCETAGSAEYGRPIAWVISDALRHIRVVGAIKRTGGWDIQLGDDDAFDNFDFIDVPHIEIIP